jgi:MOSC domain-containing protein YiiM
MNIRHLYISPGHNFFGNFGNPAGKHPITEVNEVECVAGKGIIGDRFFGHEKNYKGQITFFSWEVFQEMVEALGVPDCPPCAMRRNVLVEGGDLNKLIGQRFEIDGITFEGLEECSPCFWMEEAVAPGAEAFLKDRGGLRAKIHTSGTLHVSRSVQA